MARRKQRDDGKVINPRTDDYKTKYVKKLRKLGLVFHPIGFEKQTYREEDQDEFYVAKDDIKIYNPIFDTLAKNHCVRLTYDYNHTKGLFIPVVVIRCGNSTKQLENAITRMNNFLKELEEAYRKYDAAVLKLAGL